MAQIISLEVDGMPMNACLGVPAGKGPHPGLLVAHNQEGLGVFTHDLVDKLVAAGYVAICPDHYHECAPDADLATRRAALRDRKILRDLAVTLDALCARPDVQRNSLAVIGHCMGGRAAFMAAGAFPALKAVVAFYSSGMFMSRGNDMPTHARRTCTPRFARRCHPARGPPAAGAGPLPLTFNASIFAVRMLRAA